MTPVSRVQLLGVFVALLAASAGCQSLTGAGPGTETATGATLNGSEQSGPNSTVAAVSDRHESTLRQAGNVTVYRSAGYNWDGDRPTDRLYFNWTDRTEIEFESGRLLNRFDTSFGDASTTYRNESGAMFRYTGESSAYGPYYGSGVDLNETISPFPPVESRLEHRGAGTVDGVSGTVYVLESLDWESPGGTPIFEAENVVASSGTYVVDERGYVAYERLTLTAERETGTVTYVETKRFTDVGSTTVERPEWVDLADTNDTSTPADSDTYRLHKPSEF